MRSSALAGTIEAMFRRGLRSAAGAEGRDDDGPSVAGPSTASR